ncbi:MAG: flagellar biosynthesis anti-sigma factor FlgM [Bdellovibrionales bacterium]|nr:flagellar biosynthesis anti-sigma factor FlgM [Bdellovibrionales bacterium]
MKVDSKNVSQNLGIHQSKTKGLGKDIGGDSDKVSKGELGSSAKVDLSSRAQAMQKAKEIASDSSIDEAKVARLQKLIDAGEYKTDASAIADRLVDEHLSTF